MLNKLFEAVRGNLKNLDVRPEKLTNVPTSHLPNRDDSFSKELEKHLPIIDIAGQKRGPNRKLKPRVQRDYSKNNYQVTKAEVWNNNNKLVSTHYIVYRVYSTGSRRHVNDEAEIKWAVSQTFKRKRQY